MTATDIHVLSEDCVTVNSPSIGRFLLRTLLCPIYTTDADATKLSSRVVSAV